MNLEEMRGLAEELRKHAVKPYRVRSKEEADKLTAADVFLREWRVGDEYYIAETSDEFAYCRVTE